MPQCTARSRRTKEPCQAAAAQGKTVCWHHGGKTPSGMALPQYKDGKYSTHLPSRLASEYLRARNDPEILSTKEEIALAETRLRELLAKLESGDLSHVWSTLHATKQDFAIARTAGDVPGMTKALVTMEGLIDQGAQDWHLWQALGTQIDRMSRLRLAEHKRLIDLQLVITQDQANVLLGALVAIVMEALTKNIPDVTHVRRIYSDISRGLEAHLDTTIAPGVVRRPA